MFQLVTMESEACASCGNAEDEENTREQHY